MVRTSTIAATRFGYGFHPGQSLAADAEGLLAELASAPSNQPDIAGPSMAERAALYSQFSDARAARRKDASLTPIMQGFTRQIVEQYARDAAARIRAPIVSDRGFFERLSWFWRDHFTVGGKNVIGKSIVARFEADAIRPNIAGSFREMLRAAATHPAMIAYLDQYKSFGPGSAIGLRRGVGLNENLAREIIELHSIGVGGPYSQDDVRQFAELLTGLTLDKRSGETEFNRRRAEPGAETVMGQRYGGGRPGMDDIHAALDDLADHPRTARHIARKLAVHFVADEPSEALITHIDSAFNRTGGRLMAVYEALLEHPESWAPEQRKVKQPFDWMISAVRATGPTPRQVNMVIKPRGKLSIRRAMRQLNQPIYEAPGPDGWPEEAERWITPQGLSARIRWATKYGRAIEARTDPRAFLTSALGDLASRETTFAATNAAEKWEGIALILASPEFNRR